jgi:hypothetical protein
MPGTAVSKGVAGIDVLNERAKSGCLNPSDNREKWGAPKIFDPKYFRSPSENFHTTSHFKHCRADLRDGTIRTKSISVFPRIPHANSSLKPSLVCVFACAVGSGVSVNIRKSSDAKSGTFRPLPGGNGASEVVIK